jgi:hypothetical protein
MKRKALALLVVAIMVLGAATPSFAAADTRDISANYSGISLYIDLESVRLLDVNGNVVDPFIYDGSTYLPVRAISEALGMSVEWDAAAKVVYITEKTEDVAEDEATPVAEQAPVAEDAAADAVKTDAAADDATKADEAAVTEEEATIDATTEEAAETDDVTATEEEASAETEPFVGVRTLAASFDDIKININDNEISAKDAAGNAVEPFIVAGTTYLPVRAVAEAFGLSVSWDASTKSVYIGEQPAAAADIYAEYLAAEKVIQEAGSYEIDMDGTISITVEDEVTETEISGAIKMISHSDTDIEVSGVTTTTVAGQEVTANIYYKDGFIYTEVAGEKIKMATPIDEALKLAQAGGNLAVGEDVIKGQSKDASGKVLTFTFDGAKMSDITNGLIGSMGAAMPATGEYTISDIVCTATLDDTGALKSTRMVFSMEATVEDVSIDANYDVMTTYSQIGNVTITPPTDLSSYKEAAAAK